MQIHVLLLSEDASKFAFDTLEHVCRRIFDVVVPRCAIERNVAFSPSDGAARAVLSGNAWKSGKRRDYDKILTLCRALATHLLRDDGFVFFHVDGDTIWGQTSENVGKFEAVIVAKVREYVRGHRGPDAVEHAMRKLILLAPHYSIETWLFANVELLRTLVPTTRQDVHQRLDHWARDPTSLDAALMTKELVKIDTKHYPALAAKLPVARLLALGTSFEDAVIQAGNCGALVVRLRSSWPSYVWAEYGGSLGRA